LLPEGAPAITIIGKTIHPEIYRAFKSFGALKTMQNVIIDQPLNPMPNNFQISAQPVDLTELETAPRDNADNVLDELRSRALKLELDSLQKGELSLGRITTSLRQPLQPAQSSIPPRQ
jgi:hypothetical protein